MDQDISALADHPAAFWTRFTVTRDDLDGFNRVPHAVHLKRIGAAVCDQTRAVGLRVAACLGLNRLNDRKTTLRTKTTYVCTNFTSGHPADCRHPSGNGARGTGVDGGSSSNPLKKRPHCLKDTETGRCARRPIPMTPQEEIRGDACHPARTALRP